MSKTPKPPTKKEFDARFPDDDSCLEHLMRVRYGGRFRCAGCQRQAHYHRVKLRRSYACEWCGHQVYPTAGTPFEKTRTGLKDWFFVMFLFCTSRNGLSSKEIQRALGVTYKCAWRIGNRIRQYMGYVDGDPPLGGSGGGAKPVEIDKAFVGGADKRGRGNKKVALGMLERDGDVIAKHIPDRTFKSVGPLIAQHIKPGSRLMSDEAKVFAVIPRDEYRVETVNHARGEYVRGDVHVNALEGFWANVKRGISGTYVHVSAKHFQLYLHEFEFRHNLRRHPHLMLDALLLSFPQAAS